MDQNKYNNIYNAMNSNYSYQTYYVNSISNNHSNSTITQEQFNSVKDDILKYINK
jgi:hemoglobin-like flavoprotein